MADRIHLKIVSPEGTALERDVNYVNLPTKDGSVGILADHAPMICALARGELRFRFEGGESVYPIAGGVAGVEDNALTVLAEGTGNAE